MDGTEDPTPARTHLQAGPRHAGWAALVAVLAVGFLMIGGMLVAVLQAPVANTRAVTTGFVLIAAGLLLLPVAWLGRRRPKS